MFTSVWRQLLLSCACCCQKVLMSRSHNNRDSLWAEISSANLSVIVTTPELPLYWEWDVHLFHFWTFGSAVYWGDWIQLFEQCHVFAHSPPDRSPSNKYSLDTCTALDFCKTLYSQHYLVATVIHTQLYMQSYVYTYIFLTISRIWSGKTNCKKLGQQIMPGAKETFSHAILDLSAIGSSALA